MKLTKLFNSLLWSSIALLSVSSCTDYNTFTEADLHHEDVVNDFNERFVKEFGNPDPNHTWGWGITPDMLKAFSSVAPKNSIVTRAGEEYLGDGVIDNNRNMWLDNTLVDALMNNVHIPGWPNDDGYYYYANSSNIYEGNMDSYAKKDVPAGDITEAEIKYVSNWLQTHKLDDDFTGPELLSSLHLSDFFLQEVSRNWDYKRNGDGTLKEPHERVSIEWTKSGETGHYDDCDFKLDQLKFQTYKGTWTHISSFNDGTANKLHDIDNSPNYNVRNIQYVKSSGTEDFTAESTASTAPKAINSYKLIRLTWDETMADGKSHEREGFYLCFDYQLHKSGNEGDGANCDYEGDKYYDNWIIKITPADYVARDRWPKRIMCEDRGNKGTDFDFNDAVFDLSYAQSTKSDRTDKMDLVVKIQAAGATMPIYVAQDPGNAADGSTEYNPTNPLYEIHNLMGCSDWSKPINVKNDGGLKAVPAIYRIPTNVPATSSSWGDMRNAEMQIKMAINAFTQKIYIYNKFEKRWYSVSGASLQQNLREEGDGNGYLDGEGNEREPGKGTNPAPQLINTSVNCAWVLEDDNIGNAYPYFKNWVQDEKCAYRLKWDATKHFGLKSTATTPYNYDDYEIVDNTDPPYPAWKWSWDDVNESQNNVNKSHLYTPSIPQ